MKFKSLLLDFFRGPELEQINLGGLEWVISVTAGDNDTVYLRTYRTVLKKSGTRTPRVELTDMGPNMDLVFRRSQFASADLLKQAMKVCVRAYMRAYLGMCLLGMQFCPFSGALSSPREHFATAALVFC